MGTAVWVPHETDVWQPGVIESRTDTKDGGIELTVSLPRTGRVETFQFGPDFDELECETLKLRNTFDPADAAAGAARGRGVAGAAQTAAARRAARDRARPHHPAVPERARDPRRAAPALGGGADLRTSARSCSRSTRSSGCPRSTAARRFTSTARGERAPARPEAAPPLPPHAYAVAEGAYRAMRVAMVERAAGRGADELCDQSIS